MIDAPDILAIISAKKAKGERFALATVVRTVSMTAAKAGAKAVVLPDGTISEGWIGGGCARAAVLKAAKEALADGQVRLVSIQPADLLDEKGVAPGDERDGVRFAKNTCPSQGTMDIFVEPVLPRPEIIVCGSSPVAVAIADLGRRLGYAMTVAAPAAEQSAFADVERRIEGYALPVASEGGRFIVVSTQSRGDEAALQAALSVGGRPRRRARRRPFCQEHLPEPGHDGYLHRARVAPAAGRDLRFEPGRCRDRGSCAAGRVLGDDMLAGRRTGRVRRC